jgi:putative membrane protein
MKRNLLTGLMLALVLAAAAFAQSGDSSSAQGATQAGAAGAQEPAATQSTPASGPAPAGSAQQGTGAESAQEPSTTPTEPSSRAPAGAPNGPGSPGGAGASAPSSMLAATDKSFIRDAALGNLEAEELGRLAAEKASSPEVKSFAQKMADDHKQANDTLKQIATSLQFEPPSRPSSHAKSERAQLEKLSGADFDREFLNLVVKEHQKDVAVFERESRRAAAPSGLKSFAGTTLTGLQDHIKMAQDLSSKLGVGSPSRPSSSQR